MASHAVLEVGFGQAVFWLGTCFRIIFGKFVPAGQALRVWRGAAGICQRGVFAIYNRRIAVTMGAVKENVEQNGGDFEL